MVSEKRSDRSERATSISDADILLAEGIAILFRPSSIVLLNIFQFVEEKLFILIASSWEIFPFRDMFRITALWSDSKSVHSKRLDSPCLCMILRFGLSRNKSMKELA